MKDILCAYYTNSEEITSYMASKLGIKDKDVILEPSAGEGIFIDEVLKTNKKIHIDALDINPEAISILKYKYKDNPNITVRETDTLLDKELDTYQLSELWLKETDTLFDKQLDIFSVSGGHYSKVIGNPPYGAWQNFEKRDLLKKKYPGQYVKETYSLFLLRCLSVLKQHGRLSFIIPDTYLFLNMHARLREVLLTNTKIEEVITFPSKFFPGVSFGYSNLSIITLERCEKQEALDNTINFVQGFNSSEEFAYLLKGEKAYPKNFSVYKLNQKSVLENNEHRFILAKTETSTLIGKNNKSLGDVADIVTGFYTGDNTRFIKALDKNVKGSKNYETVNPSEVFNCEDLSGIPNVKEGYIPYIKSASKEKYFRGKDEWFVQWDSETIRYYNSNKKSRFQNSSFYFRTGVAIPMVKSSVIRAFLMENRVFDQSIVGIFPKDLNNLYYILALMNSDAINDLIHTINPTANNSANYVKQVPYLEPDKKTFNKITNNTKNILFLMKDGKLSEAENLNKENNMLISSLYGIKEKDKELKPA